jgi:DNA-binding NarL/FixJ family response regulator
MVSVFLVDDHELVRRGLREFLAEEGDLTVVGEADTAAGAVRGISETKPDVAVVDVRLPDGNGIEVCREVRSLNPEVRCLILTSYADEAAFADAVLAGASGYLLKETKTSELVTNIRKLAAGESLIDPERARSAFVGVRKEVPDLTEQEQRILDLIAEGQSNKQIATELHFAEQTVKNYVSRLMAKLGVQRRVQAALYASRRHTDR